MKGKRAKFIRRLTYIAWKHMTPQQRNRWASASNAIVVEPFIHFHRTAKRLYEPGMDWKTLLKKLGQV